MRNEIAILCSGVQEIKDSICDLHENSGLQDSLNSIGDDIDEIQSTIEKIIMVPWDRTTNDNIMVNMV